MIKVLFICHGNICRSTMAQFLFTHLAENEGYRIADHASGYADFYVDSAATSTEEIGNPVDRRTVAKLKEHGVTCGTHFARRITKKDYDLFDLIIIMDDENEWWIRRIIHEDPDDKIHMMLEYAHGQEFKNPDGSARNVADPWYTHDFEKTYKDLLEGCTGLLEHLAGNTRRGRKPE